MFGQCLGHIAQKFEGIFSIDFAAIFLSFNFCILVIEGHVKMPAFFINHGLAGNHYLRSL